MKVILLVISGKVINYDPALYDAIKKEANDASVKLFAPRYGLLSLIPKRWQHSNDIIKRLVKVAEGLLNYAYTCIKVACDKPDVLHLQWLPFMEVVGWGDSNSEVHQENFAKYPTGTHHPQHISSQYER